MRRNHDIMVRYCNQYIDDNFKNMINYLTNNKSEGLNNIIKYNKSLDIALEGLNISDIKIECKSNDVKYLNFE